jgi:peptidoglycan/LPS O-acetylase OafA/YrhL
MPGRLIIQGKWNFMRAEKERFIGLEWLRFFLGVYLVMFHTLPFYEEYTQLSGLVEFTELGFFATSSFFALSGFCLHMSTSTAINYANRPFPSWPSASPTSIQFIYSASSVAYC